MGTFPDSAVGLMFNGQITMSAVMGERVLRMPVPLIPKRPVPTIEGPETSLRLRSNGSDYARTATSSEVVHEPGGQILFGLDPSTRSSLHKPDNSRVLSILTESLLMYGINISAMCTRYNKYGYMTPDMLQTIQTTVRTRECTSASLDGINDVIFSLTDPDSPRVLFTDGILRNNVYVSYDSNECIMYTDAPILLNGADISDCLDTLWYPPSTTDTNNSSSNGNASPIPTLTSSIRLIQSANSTRRRLSSQIDVNRVKDVVRESLLAVNPLLIRMVNDIRYTMTGHGSMVVEIPITPEEIPAMQSLVMTDEFITSVVTNYPDIQPTVFHIVYKEFNQLPVGTVWWNAGEGIWSNPENWEGGHAEYAQVLNITSYDENDVFIKTKTNTQAHQPYIRNTNLKIEKNLCVGPGCAVPVV